MKMIMIFTIILIVCIFFFFFYLDMKTGIFEKDEIDEIDLQKWDYENNYIKNTEQKKIFGKNDTCWLLVHSYSSTPKEMYELSEKIYAEFNQTIFIPNLLGHRQIPSKILNYNISVWYNQVEKIYLSMTNFCENINIIGSSLGGAISFEITKNFQKKKLKNSYFINIYFSSQKYIDRFGILFGNFLIYEKKKKIGNINSPKGLENHISYFNLPIIPIKNSQNFLDNLDNNLYEIKNPIFFAHSINDETSNYKKVFDIYKKINSSKKKFIYYNKSNHILLLDYEKDKLISDIINFERENKWVK